MTHPLSGLDQAILGPLLERAIKIAKDKGLLTEQDMKEDTKTMSDKIEDSPFGRQREPVEILLIGDGRDIAHYMGKIKRMIQGTTIDSVRIIAPDRIIIDPAANND